jgi:hypothetical protein
MSDPVDLPEVWAAYRPQDGLWLPYPYSWGAGSKEAAEHIVAANARNGYLVVKLKVEVDADECPHHWESVGFHPDYGTISECRICGGRTP